MKLRVISGSARGLKLLTIDGLDTRPTLDRVKEAVFSMLLPYIQGSVCLDLFAGSGGLGIETLSRGGERAVFVDANPKCIDVIRRNVDKASFADRSEIICSDFAKYLSSANDKFDIIFLDPPYKMGKLREIFTLISDKNLLKEDGIILLEADEDTDISHERFEVLKHKTYGRVNIFILEGAK